MHKYFPTTKQEHIFWGKFVFFFSIIFPIEWLIVCFQHQSNDPAEFWPSGCQLHLPAVAAERRDNGSGEAIPQVSHRAHRRVAAPDPRTWRQRRHLNHPLNPLCNLKYLLFIYAIINGPIFYTSIKKNNSTYLSIKQYIFIYRHFIDLNKQFFDLKIW